MNGYDLIARLCQRNSLGVDGVERAIESLRSFGGMETESLTSDVVVRALRGEDGLDWKSLAWIGHEVSFFYDAHLRADKFLSVPLAVGAAIAAILVAQGVKRKSMTGLGIAAILRLLSAATEELYELDVVEVLLLVIEETKTVVEETRHHLRQRNPR